MPTRGGEKIVMRVLDSSRVKTGLQELGLEADQLMTLSHLVARPSGMVLVTGPTGSGKTSTLYACLCTVNRESVNIITIEDPIEYQLEGITQVQVDPGIELGFANGLRSSLRQDPDVIMVGEVRDPDTARVAVRAALTGHLVFSTMHANTAVGAMNTLANMGVPHYLVAPALSGIISQRLVRCICKFCREEYEVPEGELVELGMSSDTKETHFYHGAGCDKCFNTGYNGRIGVFEVVGVSPDLREALLQQKNIPEMETIARRNSISLLEAGRQKVIAGTTTASEAVKGVVLQ
jgi:type II secretory ATPase GspE/PulE/Tfp pilus assembly ATPase PilB-like protein